MKHLPTTVLLDLAEDIYEFELMYPGTPSLATRDKLASIDTELLSRMSEGEFVTMLGDNGNPVGFEPECYVRLAEARRELDEIDSYYHSPEWYQASH